VPVAAAAVVVAAVADSLLVKTSIDYTLASADMVYMDILHFVLLPLETLEVLVAEEEEQEQEDRDRTDFQIVNSLYSYILIVCVCFSSRVIRNTAL